MLIKKSFLLLAASSFLATASYASDYGYGSKKSDYKKKAKSHGKEKCYGVAKKGWNDCKTAYHDCKSRSDSDYDKTDWMYVEAGTCKQWHAKIKKKKSHHAAKGDHAYAKAPAKEKCYGVAKKGWNDCKTSYHDCKSRSDHDYDPTDWKYVKKGTCKDWHKKVSMKKKSHSSSAY